MSYMYKRLADISGFLLSAMFGNLWIKTKMTEDLNKLYNNHDIKNEVPIGIIIILQMKRNLDIKTTVFII